MRLVSLQLFNISAWLHVKEYAWNRGLVEVEEMSVVAQSSDSAGNAHAREQKEGFGSVEGAKDEEPS